MNRSHKFAALAAGALLAAVAIVPAFAQTDSPVNPVPTYPENTITVVGTGTAHGTPDIATVDVGVDVTKTTVSDAFSEANTKIQDIIKALTDLGIASADIQTSNLSVYSTSINNPDTGKDEMGYDVSNTVHVIVRDASKAESVINAAINAGATTLYGLSFDIQDRTVLEQQAREDAMKDATARAQAYAALINGKLGDVVVLTETQVGGQPVALYARPSGAGANSVVSPGQTDVQIQVSVTYQILH